MNQSPHEFCAALKAARERRGLKLADVARATKVCPSHFSALERGDLRLWPKGLFRRSFFRAYAAALDLPVEPTLEEFLQLFPEDPRAAQALGAATSECRLILDNSWRGPREPLKWRFGAAGIDAAAVAMLAFAVSWLAGITFLAAGAVVGVGYFTLATVALADSPAHFCVRRRDRIAATLRSFLSPKPPVRTETDADEEQSWIDAHDPGAEAAGLRVRFKVSS